MPCRWRRTGSGRCRCRRRENPGAAIRCAANQRLAAWLHDQGHRDRAWQAIEAAEDNRWTMALLGRAATILAKGWPTTKAGTLPWVFEDNRPALRLLWLYIERIREDSPDRAERFARLYLRLNPNDNHGVRAPLVNHLLKTDRDADPVVLNTSLRRGLDAPRDDLATPSSIRI